VNKDDGRAKIVPAENGVGRLELAEPFDGLEAHRLVLDRVGFTVEDRDRSKGFYFVRYVDPEADALDKKNDSFLAKLMFGAPRLIPRPSSYRVFVKDRNDSSDAGPQQGSDPASSDTARRILSRCSSN